LVKARISLLLESSVLEERYELHLKINELIPLLIPAIFRDGWMGWLNFWK